MYLANRLKLLMPVITLLLVAALFPADAMSQRGTRENIKIPDIRGYLTLKCDFHMHTVFSDGSVWPTVRVEEAWRDGLDVIAISDHIEYQPHKHDIPTQHNRPHELAKPSAEASNLILIRGTEITRAIPPGHHNAIFTTDNSLLEVDDFYESVKAATDQGAFIFYNHPGWRQPEEKSVWFEQQTENFAKKRLHGIEVVNGGSYYPLAHQWAIDKKLTMMGTTDVHNPLYFDYDYSVGEHRPMNLVFAKKRTAESVKDALFAGRTAIWWKNYLIGDEKYLRPIFDETVEVITSELTITGNGGATLQVSNDSCVSYELEIGDSEFVTAPKNVTLSAGRTVRIALKKKDADVFGRKKIRLPITVKNLYVLPNTGLEEEITFSMRFEKPAEK